MDSHSPLVLTRVAMCQVAQLSSSHRGADYSFTHIQSAYCGMVGYMDTDTSQVHCHCTAAGMPGTQETLTLPTIQSVLANHAWMCKILIIFLLPSYDCLATQ